MMSDCYGIRLQLFNLRLLGGSATQTPRRPRGQALLTLVQSCLSGKVSADVRKVKSSSSDKGVHSVSPGGGASFSCNMARFLCVKRPQAASFLQLLFSSFSSGTYFQLCPPEHMTKVRLRRDDSVCSVSVGLLRNQTLTIPLTRLGAPPPDPR